MSSPSPGIDPNIHEEVSFDGNDSEEDEISHSTNEISYSTNSRRVGHELLYYFDGQPKSISIEHYKRRMAENARLAIANLDRPSSSVTGSNSLGAFADRINEIVQITSVVDAQTIASKLKLDIASANGSSHGISYTQAIKEYCFLEAAIMKDHPNTVAGVSLSNFFFDCIR
jgi:hypothetical protein